MQTVHNSDKECQDVRENLELLLILCVLISLVFTSILIPSAAAQGKTIANEPNQHPTEQQKIIQKNENALCQFIFGMENWDNLFGI